jgi:hypothetical protein
MKYVKSHVLLMSCWALLVVVPVMQAADTGLIGALTSGLGVTQEQAEAGAGALFNYAKQQLDAEQFSQIAAAVPGIDKLMDMAPQLGGIGGLVGGASSMLGGGADSLGGMATLGEAFSKLGMGSDMVSQFIPIVLDYVKQTEGEAVKDLLQQALPI